MKPLYQLVLFITLLPSVTLHAYPLDGYRDTGIRRVEAARLAASGELPGRKQPVGALLPLQYVELRLLDHPDLDLPQPDPAFTAKIVSLLGKQKNRYGISVLDLSDPTDPLYAEYRGDHRQNVGSVGKLLVVLALFQTLADIYPDDLGARKRVLYETIITADDFIRTDHHTVRLWDPVNQKLIRRPLQIGDQGNLWEWLDWMLSASSNAAAATVMQQAMLLMHYGKDYPAEKNESREFFAATPRQELGELFIKTFIDPIIRNGLDIDSIRQGSFFTHYGKKKVPGTNSYGTPRQLLLFALRMEQGRLVDVFSSREMKRLLYMTERRIRYASSPALIESAVYFKSGSLYKCKPGPGFSCKKYHGNVVNYMNSVAIVESPVGENRLNYIATLLSNVLYKNSAVEHQTLGTRIHRVIESLHPIDPKEPGDMPFLLDFGEHLIGYEEKFRQRQMVANIQSSLEKLGYPVGVVDGKSGPNTRRAIKKFQSDQNISVNGNPSVELLEYLNKTVAHLSQQPPRLEQ